MIYRDSRRKFRASGSQCWAYSSLVSFLWHSNISADVIHW